MKKTVIIGYLLLFPWLLSAQILEPITWTVTGNAKNDTLFEVVFNAKIEKGWHLYATELPQGGPVATQFHFDRLQDAALQGDILASRAAEKSFDENFQMQLQWYEKEVSFTQLVKVQDGFVIAGNVEFMGCNDNTCLPPSHVDFSFGAEPQTPIGLSEIATPFLPLSAETTDLWTPVVDELRSFDTQGSASTDSSLWWIFIKGLLGGFIALLTPCVWPIIPMTVSFFLKKSKNKKKGILDASLFGVSIIFIYLFLGIVITLIFGASALNSLSTNAVFNIFFFLLLVLFAVSFFGAFEITLPASWSTKINAKSESTTGFLSVLLMAFTLVLVSFSCTGPIIGTLLVDVSVNGSLLAPAVGMGGFALALALPFTLFAMFPTWLKSLPKSGGWLNSVKVVLGFLELAFALKFLSVADLAYGWHILDRETFLVLWIVIFALLGFYLLGKIKFPHDSELKHVSVPRFFLSLISLAFAVYLVPGLWGAPLKSVSAFIPPLSTQDFNMYDKETHTVFNDYEQGMNYAKKANKPVLIDFSGYGCVNCRKMESAVLTNNQVNEMLTDEFVLITLFVDDKTSLESPMTIVEQGKERILTTVGDKNSYLQRFKFGANAQPFYVILNPQGEPLAGSFSFDDNPQHFIDYLNVGLKNMKKY